MQNLAPDPASGRSLRDALGRFATGVTVVTAAGADGPAGITANSFASVSLDPALVHWCLGRDSARYPVFAGAGRFAIHVLSSAQRDFAARFTRHAEDFSGLEVEAGPDGVPLIAGCLARFLCRRVSLTEAGDHAVILGAVEAAEYGEGQPLVFSQGRYGSFAPGH